MRRSVSQVLAFQRRRKLRMAMQVVHGALQYAFILTLNLGASRENLFKFKLFALTSLFLSRVCARVSQCRVL